MGDPITVTTQDTTNGWIIPCGDSWDIDLPWAAVWATTGPQTPGTAATAQDAWDLVATDAFGECTYWPTQEAAAEALRRTQDEVLEEILG